MLLGMLWKKERETDEVIWYSLELILDRRMLWLLI